MKWEAKLCHNLVKIDTGITNITAECDKVIDQGVILVEELRLELEACACRGRLLPQQVSLTSCELTHFEAIHQKDLTVA